MAVTPSTPLNTHVVLDGISWQTYERFLGDYELQPGTRLTYELGRLEIGSGQLVRATDETACMCLGGISWQTYESLLEDYESKPGTRLTYNRGWLEIVTPLQSEHEFYKETLKYIVDTATRALQIEVHSLGSTTWKREDLERGAEADECFYIQNEALVRGRKDIRLPDDPPPDLVIEVDNTNSSLKKLEIYAALGIAEVWVLSGESLSISQLVDGNYEAVSASVALPILPVEDIEYLLSQREGMGRNAFLDALELWMQQHIEQTQGAEREQSQL